jgi:hypothetical protein
MRHLLTVVSALCGSAASIVVPLTAMAFLATAALAGSPPPTVTTTAVYGLGRHEVVAVGTIQGHMSNYWFAYGTSRPLLGHTFISEETYGGTEPVEVEEVLEGLRPGTTYKYRLVAIYGPREKRVRGGIETFTTKP